jgi:hypothetical protein
LANNGFLVNASSLTSDPAEFQRLRGQPGHIDAVVAESSNRLLIPWFLCFRVSDLRPVPYNGLEIQLPCTTVEQALRNMEQSLPVFEAIAGSAALGQPYWKLACEGVRRLPLAYLALSPIEILDMDGNPQVPAAQIVGAVSGDLSAVPHLKALSEYQEGPPYPLDVLYGVGQGIDPHGARNWNASVLDGGFLWNFDYVHWNKADDVAAPRVPALPDAAFGELRDVKGLVEAWIKADAPGSRAIVGLGLLPGTPEQLVLRAHATSEADVQQMQASAGLRSRLDALARERLEPWCRKNGFGWAGCEFSVLQRGRR